MFAEPDPISITVDALVVLCLLSAIAMASLYWLRKRRLRRIRERFVDLYNPTDLRMNPYKLGVVYVVVGQTEDRLRVVPVWDADKPVVDGKEYEFDPQNLAPFDYDLFVSKY